MPQAPYKSHLASPLGLMARPMHCRFSISIFMAFSIPWFIQSVTLRSDIEALQSLRNGIDPNLIPPSSFLNTWELEADPCDSTGGIFLGILCTEPQNNISRVSIIDLDESGYDGFLSAAIGNLTELTTLQISNNKFRGPIPISLYNLQKLNTLSLSRNFFTGSLPREIQRLKRLNSLDLSDNSLSGSIPERISMLRSLNFLSLSNNQLTGQIPNLSNLWQLNTLDLSSNNLHGTLPHLPLHLRTLILSHNGLSGHISTLGAMPSLKTLDLSDNRFSGPITGEIVTLPNLNRINASLNSFSVVEVIQIPGGESQLQVLDVHGNSLSGRLPLNLVTYGNLTEVNLGSNQFSGQIPVEYGGKLGGEWRSLFLDHNYLVGTLPSEFTDGGGAYVRGSVAQNCLTSCPLNVRWCRGGQRSASRCNAQNGNTTVESNY